MSMQNKLRRSRKQRPGCKLQQLRYLKGSQVDQGIDMVIWELLRKKNTVVQHFRDHTGTV